MSDNVDMLGAITSILDNAATREREIAADRRFVQQYKQQAIQEQWNEAKASATYLAKSWLSETHQAAEQAAQALNEAQAKFDASLDYGRLQLASIEMQALGNSARDLPTVAAVVQQAIRTRDYASLRALHRVALPLLKARQATQETGELRRAAGGFDSLASRIEAALSELEPADLRTARQTAVQAAQAAQRAAIELGRINWRHSRMRGGAGPLSLDDAPGVADYSSLNRQWI